MNDKFSRRSGKNWKEDSLGLFTRFSFSFVHFHWTTTESAKGSPVSDVPEGMVLIPKGPFLYGETGFAKIFLMITLWVSIR